MGCSYLRNIDQYIVDYKPVSSVTIVTRLRTGQQEYLCFITDDNETQLRLTAGTTSMRLKVEPWR